MTGNAPQPVLDTILGWLHDPGLTIVVILFLAWLFLHFGGIVITRVIRGIIVSSHFNVISADDARKRQDTLIGLFKTLWKIVTVVITFFLVFSQVFPHVNLIPIFASAGIAGIAIGFGAQSVIKDLFSGAFIIMENQYRIGDVVDIDGAAGTVERIGLRSTIIRDGDGNVHFLPNGSVIHVINKTMGYSRVNLTLGVAPDTDIDALATVIDNVGRKMIQDSEWKDKLIEPPHFLSIGAFSDISLEVKVTAKTQPSSQWDVTGELRRRLLRAFTKHKIELSHTSTPLSAK